jgi:predicted transcriptional regulator
MEQSTIKLSKRIKNDLKKQMNHPGETYETVIARLLKIAQEDDDVLSNIVIKNIEEGIADIKAGRVYTSEQVKKKLKLK